MDFTGWSLEEAQAWLRERVAKGEKCPCCGQHAKVYRRKINSGMARALIAMYRHAGTDWLHKPTALRGLGAAARDESVLRYWGLLEEATERREDHGHAGWWRVTALGARFARGEIRVQKYARIYDGRCLGLTGDMISIQDALGSKFDLRELLGE